MILYNDSTIYDILEHIIHSGYSEEKTAVLDIPEKPVPIKCPADINEKLVPFSLRFAEREKQYGFDTYGFRKQKQLQVMLKTNALLERRDEVTMDDFEVVKQLNDYMNLDYKRI